jgi:ketosteroid isomerase-like protein
MARVTQDQVRAEVSRFWNLFVSKSPALLEDFYAADATVFATSSRRAEPGRLAVARRRREYFDRQTSVRVQVGDVEVQLIDEFGAIASYTFQFHASRVTKGLGNSIEERLSPGRATQVFVVDSENQLRILHEHFSAPSLPNEKH